MMLRRRTVNILLTLLALVLAGTVVVLSSISYYLSIDLPAYITELELDAHGVLPDTQSWNATQHGMVERIPRILHQTWKSETLPSKWADVSQACREMMPDYEYMLWTDASAREFIAEHYPWFLDTFDGYTYPIQRADAIRYFILHHYGGVYLDLDIGCLRRLDPLLVYPVILAKTIPVGVSNDLIFAEKGHPFMEQTIRQLIPFDHSWVLNYPTVMFSTGPMFLSAQYGLYTSSHLPTLDNPGGEVRILPKALYGKNAKPDEAPHSFFTHYYGSSWHADDAAFVGFLGKWGKALMWVGLVVLIGGLVRMLLAPTVKPRQYSLRRIGGYDVMMPRWTQRNGRWHIDLGWFSLPAGTSSPPSPILPTRTSSDEEEVQLLPLPFGSRPPSPSSSEGSLLDVPALSARGNLMLDTVRGAGERVVRSLLSPLSPSVPYGPQPLPRRRRGVLFFLPAFVPQSQDLEDPVARSTSSTLGRSPFAPPPEKATLPDSSRLDYIGGGPSSDS